VTERRYRVLVLDDDEIIRGFLSEALNDEGYEVRQAASGREGLNVLQEWRPNLILLDLMMPEMDGWAFRDEQRRRPELADIPVIVLSAARELQLRSQHLAAADVIAKPFDLDDLLASVARVIARNAAS